MKTLLLFLLVALPLGAQQQWNSKTGRGQGGSTIPSAASAPVCANAGTPFICGYQDIEDALSADPRPGRMDWKYGNGAAIAPPDVGHVTTTLCSGSDGTNVTGLCLNENSNGTISSFALIDASIAAERARILAEPNCTVNSDFANAIRDGRCPVPAGGAAQFIGANYGDNGNNGGVTTSTGTRTVGIPGDLVLVALSWQANSSAPTSVTDSNGIEGALVVGPVSDGASTPTYTAIYQFPATPAGSDTFTATWAAAVNWPRLSMYEFQGAASSSPTEGPISSALNYSSGSFTCGSPGSVTTSETNETIFTLANMQYATVTATGYTALTGGNVGQAYISAIATSGTTVTPSYTANNPYSVACMAFGIKRN